MKNVLPSRRLTVVPTLIGVFAGTQECRQRSLFHLFGDNGLQPNKPAMEVADLALDSKSSTDSLTYG